MPRYFFRGFLLTIFFVSTSLLSMHENRINKSLAYSSDFENKQRKQKVILPYPSLSVPIFKQQSIELPSDNNINQYVLIFNRNQLLEPCITQYLLRGMQVAKLTQIGDDINFESIDCKAPNFSLQIPYQAGALTINTRGRCVFEKKIDVSSARVVGKAIDFCDEFFSKNYLIVESDSCKNHAQLICSDFLFEGRIFEHSGMLEVLNNCIMEKGDLFSSTSSSVCNVDGYWKAFMTSFCLKGSFSVEALFLEGEKFISESPFHCIAGSIHLKFKENMSNAGVIKVSGLFDIDAKNINLKQTSCIIVDNADLKVEKEIQNEGTLWVKNHLSAYAHSISNAGKIETSSSNIKANWYYYNKIFSTLIAKNSLTINTPLSLNVLGSIEARNLTINSAIGINALGIYIAKNMGINTLFSLNMGLLLPKFNTFAEMCSWQTLWGLGESLFIKHAPTYGVMYAALKNIQGLYHQGRAFCNEISSLSRQKRIGISDIIASLYLTKTIIDSVLQTSHLGKQSYSLLSGYSKTNSLQVPVNEGPRSTKVLPDIVPTLHDIAKQIVAGMLSYCGSSVTTNSIIDCNAGAATGFSNHSNSCHNRNLNVSLYAYNTINTHFGRNAGYLGAYNLNMNAFSFYSDNNIAVSNGVIETDHILLNGFVTAFKNIVLKGTGRAVIHADVKADNAMIQFDEEITNSGRLNVSHANLHSNFIMQNGTITAEKNVVMHTHKAICNRGNINASNIFVTHSASVEAKDNQLSDLSVFVNEGTLHASDKIVIDEKNVFLKEKSDISAPQVYIKADASCVENDGKINAEQCAIDCQGKVINNGTINSSQLFYVKAQDVLFQRESRVKAKNAYYKTDGDVVLGGITDVERGSVDAHGKVTAIGRIGGLNQLDINAAHITIEKAACISAPIACLKAIETIDNSGTLSASDLLVHAQYVENSGKIIADKAHIKADRLFWNKWGGYIKGEDALTIDAFIALNTLGYIGAHSLCTRTIIDLNLLGIYQGYTICQQSFIGLNAGILLPQFKSLRSLQEPLDWRRLFEAYGMNSFPRLSVIYSLCKSAGLSFFAQDKASSLYEQINKLWQQIRYLTNKKDICASEVVPILCDVKNVLTSVIQTGNQAYEFAAHHWNNPITSEESNAHKPVPIFSAPLSRIESLLPTKISPLMPQLSMGSLLSTTCSVIGPQLSRSSVCDTNSGLLFGINSNSQSLYNKNSGVSFFANNYSMNVLLGENSGFIGGGNISLGASRSYASGGILGALNLSVIANNVDIMGNTYAFHNMLLKAHENAALDREIKARHITIFAKNMHIAESAAIVSRGETNVIAEQTLINKGIIAGKQTLVQGNAVVLGNKNSIEAQGSDATVAVKATKSLDMHKGAKISSEGKAAVISAQHAQIDGSITGNETAVLAKTLDIQENAHIASESQTNVIAEQTLTNRGAIDGKQTLVQGDKVVLGKGNTIGVQGNGTSATINAKALHLQDGSLIAANTAFINAQSLQGEKGNTIVSQNGTFIQTNQLDNKGVVKGKLEVQFSGDESQLKGIGSVKQLAYKGAVSGGIADKLAQGHNELIDVAQEGAVALCTEQNVHLTEEHNITHAFSVQTAGDLRCDKDLFSEKSIALQAQGNIQHASVRSQDLTEIRGKNISSAGNVTREYDGQNYKDMCEKNHVSGSQVIINAQENVHYTSTNVHSGKGNTQLVCQKLIADAHQLEEYSKREEVEKTWRKTITTTTQDLITTNEISSFTSEGTTYIQADKGAELYGTAFGSQEGTIIQAPIDDVPTYDTHVQLKRTEEKKIGLCNKTVVAESISHKRLPILFEGKKTPVIASDMPISMTLKCESPEITINAPVVEVKVPQQSTQTTRYAEGKYAGLWERETGEQSQDVVFDQAYSGKINTNAQTIHIEDTKSSATIINAQSKNPIITRSLLEDMRTQQKKSRNRPTRLAMGVVALSISMAMQALAPVVGAGVAKMGIESAMVSAMTTQATLGGMNAFCQEAANTLLHCNGDFHEAAKKIASTQTARNIAKTALTAAAAAGADRLLDKVVPPLSQAKTFNERCLSAAPREFIKGGMRCASDIAQGKEAQEAVKNSLKSAAANTIGSVCSSQIGQAYGDEKIDPITHKALHVGVGAVEGAILDGKNGAIVGALGAGIAETIADIAAPKPPSIESIKNFESQLGRSLTQDEFVCEWNRQTAQYLKQAHSVGDASKMIAATVAGLVNQDMDIAYNTASKAVDNNFLVLAAYGIVGLSTAYSAYQIYNTYEQDGAVEALKHLGVEVALNAACVGAGKIAFKVGGKLYPSARAAISTALNEAPGLKSALGNAAESLITAAEKLAGTTVGKQIARANQYVKPLETKLINVESKITEKIGNARKQVVDKATKVTNKVADKVGKQINPSFATDVAEHVVPGSVINHVEKQLASKAATKSSKQLAKQAAKKSAEQLALPAPEKTLLLPKPVVGEAAKEVSKGTAGQLMLPAPEKTLLLPKPVASEVAKETASVLNQDSVAILNNGYYEVNGFKFSELYYNRLWTHGRQGPSLIAKEILEAANICIPDTKKSGFFRYECEGWEMIYNPVTKEIWHLMQVSEKK